MVSRLSIVTPKSRRATRARLTVATDLQTWGPFLALTLAAWNLTAFVSSRVMFPRTGLPIAPYVWNYFFCMQEKVTQNCCHQMRFLGSRCLKNALAAGRAQSEGPRTRWRSLQRFPKSIAGFDRDASRRRREKERYVKELGREKGRRGRKSKGRDRREGVRWKGGGKKNLVLYSSFSLRALWLRVRTESSERSKPENFPPFVPLPWYDFPSM